MKALFLTIILFISGLMLAQEPPRYQGSEPKITYEFNASRITTVNPTTGKHISIGANVRIIFFSNNIIVFMDKIQELVYYFQIIELVGTFPNKLNKPSKVYKVFNPILDRFETIEIFGDKSIKRYVFKGRTISFENKIGEI